MPLLFADAEILPPAWPCQTAEGKGNAALRGLALWPPLCSDAHAGLQLARGMCCRCIAQLWGSGKQLAASALVSKESQVGISLAPRGPGAAACPITLHAIGTQALALHGKRGKHKPAHISVFTTLHQDFTWALPSAAASPLLGLP